MAPKPRGQSGLFMISHLDLASRQPLEGRVQQYRFSSYYHSSREKQGKDNPSGHYILRCRCDQILYQYDVDIGATNPQPARKKRWKQPTRKFSRHASSASASSSAGSAKNTAAPTAGWRETGLKPASANGRAERLEISKRESSHNSPGNWA